MSPVCPRCSGRQHRRSFRDQPHDIPGLFVSSYVLRSVLCVCACVFMDVVVTSSGSRPGVCSKSRATPRLCASVAKVADCLRAAFVCGSADDRRAGRCVAALALCCPFARLRWHIFSCVPDCPVERCAGEGGHCDASRPEASGRDHIRKGSCCVCVFAIGVAIILLGPPQSDRILVHGVSRLNPHFLEGEFVPMVGPEVIEGELLQMVRAVLFAWFQFFCTSMTSM